MDLRQSQRETSPRFQNETEKLVHILDTYKGAVSQLPGHIHALARIGEGYKNLPIKTVASTSKDGSSVSLPDKRDAILTGTSNSEDSVNYLLEKLAIGKPVSLRDSTSQKEEILRIWNERAGLFVDLKNQIREKLNQLHEQYKDEAFKRGEAELAKYNSGEGDATANYKVAREKYFDEVLKTIKQALSEIDAELQSVSHLEWKG